MTKKKRYSNEFKALEAIHEALTLAELSKKHAAHPAWASAGSHPL